MLATISFIMLAVSIATPEAASPPSIAPETRAMMEQPLAPFEDQCRESDGVQVRRVRFATLDAAGRNHEDRIELRTTTTGAVRVLEYLVNGAVMFIQSTGEALRPTAAGLAWLRATNGGRVTKILAAFAAAHPRILAADVETPHHSCGATAGVAEERVKCGAIALGGCLSGIPAVCVASGGLALLCNYAIDKVCEENPDSCQPGWTEG